MLHRFGWALSGALALLAVLALARATVAGPLDPPGPVASTMRTLDQLLPAWSQTLSSTGGCSSPRFQCVMTGNAAVLDKETGLVWLRSPVETFTPYGVASDACGLNTYAGRIGWRLPTTTEMWTLIDTSADSLPDGHPFQNVSGGPYWTTTVNREDDRNLQTIAMFGGFNEELAKSRYGNDPFSVAGAWCVRGGQAPANDAAPAEQPAWSRTLSSEGGCDSARFECVMNGVAVLDRETGLVWEQAPSTTTASMSNTDLRCAQLTTGGRLGWRLPADSELLSLLDPTQFDQPGVPAPAALPVGHPFSNVNGAVLYWVQDRALPPFNNTAQMRLVSLSLGILNQTDNSFLARGWCVRGAGDAPNPW